MNHFNLLPPEIIYSIFKKLNSNDLISLRIVDKRFKEICEQIKIKQLIVSDELDNCYQPFWFYTNDLIYLEENLIEFSKFKNYAKIFQLDKHLKRLALKIDNFNFLILNEFKLLEQLDILTNKLIDNYKLSLDRIKIVDIYLKDNSSFKLTFDTIKLFAFRFVNENYSKDNFVFNYPERVLFFVLDYYNNWSSIYDDYLKNFNNLQYLKLIGSYSSLDRDILSKLKNLEILVLSMKYYNEEYDNELYGNLIKDIKFIINEKENLKRSELEIYLNDVQLINQNKLNQFKFSLDPTEFNYNLFEFQIKNYDLLKDNCDTNKINYCDLIKLIKIIPSSFANKFPFIHHVKANDHINDEDQFIKFLNNLPYLSALQLINCELTKSFYDKLTNLVYLNDLKYLTIEEKKDLEMNFDFILNLRQLECFETNQIIANHIDLIYKLFKRNENMVEFIFKFDLKNYVQIDACYNDEFGIRSYYLDDNLKGVDNFDIGSNDLDDLILKLKELKY